MCGGDQPSSLAGSVGRGKTRDGGSELNEEYKLFYIRRRILRSLTVQQTSFGEELTVLKNILPCHFPYSVRRQIKLENTSHDFIEPSDMDKIGNLLKRR